MGAGCGSGAPDSPTLQVFAASSLAEAFQGLADAFEVAEGTRVSLAYAGSQVLRLQIEQGAPAQVFASANPDHVHALVAEGLLGPPQVFATNELVLIVPLDNPAGIESFAELTRAQRLVIGSPDVPVGTYARAVLGRAALSLGTGFERTVLGAVVSEESNVRLVRAKVELGEADAALVYRTDAVASKGVRALEIPPQFNVRAEYLMGIVKPQEGNALAILWMAFVRSSEGQRILREHGFGPI